MRNRTCYIQDSQKKNIFLNNNFDISNKHSIFASKKLLIMEWYEKYLSVYEKPFSEVPQEVIDQTHDQLTALQNENPLISIIIVAYNEEKHLQACLWSLSDIKCKYPVEFIGVDNESKDRTAEIYQKSGIPYYTEHQHTCGYARQCGLNHAKGKYAMCIDSDTIYPPYYFDIMVENLMKPGISAVAAMWSFYPTEIHPKLKLKLYEFFRDIYIRLQNINRPELSVRGLAFGYGTENAKKEGYRVELLRGEDGSMALAMKKYGKIKFVFDRRCRVITGYGSLKENSLIEAMWNRLKFYGISKLFYKTNHYVDAEDNFLKKK